MHRSILRTVTAAALSVGLIAVGATGALAHETHEVRPGDTLSSIVSESDEISTWRELYQANADEIADPSLIFPGQVLTITPASDVASASASASAASSSGGTPDAPSPQGAVSMGVWDRLAECESGGDWSINTGNGFYGGLQFTRSSWEWVGGSGYPHQASRSEQIARAETLLERQGWNAWPACSRQLGLR